MGAVSLKKKKTKHEFKLGEGGQIYAKLTKNRGGVVGLEAVFPYDGNTGVVKGNHTPTEAEQNSLPFEPQQRDNNDPF